MKKKHSLCRHAIATPSLSLVDPSASIKEESTMSVLHNAASGILGSLAPYEVSDDRLD